MHSQKRIGKRHNGASEFKVSVARSLTQLECVYVWTGWKRSWQTHSALGSITECLMYESDSSLLCEDVKPCHYWHSKSLSGDYLICIFSIVQNIFMVVKDQAIFFFFIFTDTLHSMVFYDTEKSILAWDPVLKGKLVD